MYKSKGYLYRVVVGERVVCLRRTASEWVVSEERRASGLSQKNGELITSAAAAVLLSDLRLSCFLCLDLDECDLEEEVDLELLLELLLLLPLFDEWAWLPLLLPESFFGLNMIMRRWD